MQVFLPSPLAVSLCLPACDHLRLEHTALLTTLHIRADNTPVACWRVKAIHGLSPPVRQGALYTTDGENKVTCSWSKMSSAPEPLQSRATVGRVVTWKGWAAQAGRDPPPAPRDPLGSPALCPDQNSLPEGGEMSFKRCLRTTVHFQTNPQRRLSCPWPGS